MSFPPDDRDVLDQVFRSYVQTTTALYRADQHDFVSLLTAADFPLDNIKGKDWRGVDFDGDDLRNLDFSGCDLRGATFRNAKIAGCRFHGAKVLKDTFDGSDGLEQAMFDGPAITLQTASARSMSGYAIAERMIADELEARSGILDLGGLALDEIPQAIASLTHLHTLNLGGWWVNSNDEIVDAAHKLGRNQFRSCPAAVTALTGLKSLFLAKLPIDEINAVAKLTRLEELILSATPVRSLAPLAGLLQLKRLNCSATRVSDLSPVSALEHLERLTCSHSAVASLEPVARLKKLSRIDCVETGVINLEPVRHLKQLRWLNCAGTDILSIDPLVGLGALTHLNFARTSVTDIGPLARLQSLVSLDLFRTQVVDLSPLSELANLRRINCSSTKVTDLTPLMRLSGLEKLDFASTRVSDLTPLTGLNRLQFLDCSTTRVSNLSAVASLQELRGLDCFNTPIRDLTPLARLANLQWVNFSGTGVSDMTPISRLSSLKRINCSRTAATSFEPLRFLINLEEIECFATPVVELEPLSNLRSLKKLSCSETGITSFDALSALPQLSSVSCSYTPATDLSPILLNRSMRHVRAEHCRFSHLPTDPEVYARLKSLSLTGSRARGIPDELFYADENGADQRAVLTAYFKDLAAGMVSLPTAKLVVVGNVGVGKTALLQRLLGDSFEVSGLSDLGYGTRVGVLRRGSPARDVQISAWDMASDDAQFGGLEEFRQSRAIFLVCWSPEFECARSSEPAPVFNEHRRVCEWLDDITQISGGDTPVIVVQTRCESHDMVAALDPGARRRGRSFGFFQELSYSAYNDRGRSNLNQAVSDAIDFMHENYSDAMVSRGWIAVANRLAVMKSKLAVDASGDKIQSLSRRSFDEICAEVGGISSTDTVLDFLNSIGVVSRLSEGIIVIRPADQLSAIRLNFESEHIQLRLSEMGGRFRRAFLVEAFGSTYSPTDLDVLGSMIESRGLAFRLPVSSDDSEQEFIVPQSLPARHEMHQEITRFWNGGADFEPVQTGTPISSQRVMHEILVDFARRAGSHGIYWASGLAAYDGVTQGWMMIDLPRGGLVTISARGKHSEELLSRVSRRVGALNRRYSRSRGASAASGSGIADDGSFAFCAPPSGPV